MDQAQLNWLTNFIWNIADDVLRDVFVRGKYRDVILPMTVLRRLDAVLEPTKKAVLDMKAALDLEQVTNQDDALRAASGEAFYNTSPFLLRDLKSRATQQKLKDDFEAYLDGFSPNVQDILTNFEFRHQIPRLSKADALGQLIEKFLDKDINISPYAVGELPGLDNHSMGTMFEELVRRFNEDNNEEAGEHWTPRDAVRLMANLMFLPVADKIESGTYLLYDYDCACGTGGMLTVAEETLQKIAKAHGKQVATHLYGQEINGETYAICKADLLLKGDGDAADNSVLIAITGQGKTRGTSAVLGFEATINQHIAYITQSVPVVIAKYLHLSLVAAYPTLRSMSDDSGSTKGALTCEALKRFKIAVPPVDEQQRLVEAISAETKAANTAIARTEREIALMQEYRTRVTADIVTGKLDVREAAAKLPALPADPAAAPVIETLDEPGELEETEPEEI